eukprot:53921_1
MSRRYCLYVGNIPATAQPDDIEYLFAEYGKLYDFYFKTTENRRNYAFVEFKHSRHASDALYELHGHRIYGVALKIEWARKHKRYKTKNSNKHKVQNATPNYAHNRSLSVPTISTPSVQEIIDHTKQKINQKYAAQDNDNNINKQKSSPLLQNNQTTHIQITIDQLINTQTIHTDPVANIKIQYFQLLLLVMNGNQHEQKSAMCAISGKIYTYGVRLLLECITQLFMFPTIRNSNKESLIPIIDNIIHKLNVEIKPYINDMCSIVAPLLIDTDEELNRKSVLIIERLTRVIGKSEMLNIIKRRVDNSKSKEYIKKK